MPHTDNVATIQAMFAAFQRGDIATIVEHVAADCTWIHPGPDTLPFDGTFLGQGGVTAFFMALAETLDFTQFEPQQYIADGDDVVAVGRLAANVKSTGKSYQTDWAMVFRFREGKLVWYHQHYDTAAITEAFS